MQLFPDPPSPRKFGARHKKDITRYHDILTTLPCHVRVWRVATTCVSLKITRPLGACATRVGHVLVPPLEPAQRGQEGDWEYGGLLIY